MENILELKKVVELQEYKFFIPSYQRGYRWNTKQVEDLLNDIDEFMPREVDGKKNEKTWYCLQPIVIKKRQDGQYEVIDGQQRLTTIYLILFYLNSVYTEENRSPLFEINYETRIDSTEFLKNLKRNEENDKNIDFFYISKAYQHICNWFKNPTLIELGMNQNSNFILKLFGMKVLKMIQ